MLILKACPGSVSPVGEQSDYRGHSVWHLTYPRSEGVEANGDLPIETILD
jgi:hypothetical protein